MKLKSIALTNYRCHRHLEVDFRPGFNVIVGVNGSGKTSLLTGVRDALKGFAHYVAGHRESIADDAVRIERVSTNGRLRFEPQYPIRVEAVGELLGRECQWWLTKIAQTAQVEAGGNEPGRVWREQQAAKGSAEEGSSQSGELEIPLVAFYPAYRKWPPARPNEMQAATERPSRKDGLQDWWDAASNSAALQQWAIGKSMERLQISSEQSIAWDDINNDELAAVNHAIAEAVEGARGLRYDFTQKSLMMEWQSIGNTRRDATVFEHLSDGQRVAIALVADIARRMCLLNPQFGTEVATKTTGVVLIDELDIHLHPSWQRQMTRGLKAAFPGIQFIAATHSPQVLSELLPEEIIVLQPGGTAHPQISYGLDSSRVLEQIMGATARPIEIEQGLSELFAALERNELVLARILLDKLGGLAPGLPELAGASALLKRKEVLGR